MEKNTNLQIKVGLLVAKPASEVFEAIVDPQKMVNYFISGSTGRMEEGVTVQWEFPEMKGSFPVYVSKAEAGKLVSFRWNAGGETLVQITLNAVSENITFVVITEGEKENNEAGIQWLKSNTEGWANFLACLKAYLEYGINLRRGAFDPSQMPEEKPA